MDVRACTLIFFDNLKQCQKKRECGTSGRFQWAMGYAEDTIHISQFHIKCERWWIKFVIRIVFSFIVLLNSLCSILRCTWQYITLHITKDGWHWTFESVKNHILSIPSFPVLLITKQKRNMDWKEYVSSSSVEKWQMKTNKYTHVRMYIHSTCESCYIRADVCTLPLNMYYVKQSTFRLFTFCSGRRIFPHRAD